MVSKTILPAAQVLLAAGQKRAATQSLVASSTPTSTALHFQQYYGTAGGALVPGGTVNPAVDAATAAAAAQAAAYFCADASLAAKRCRLGPGSAATAAVIPGYPHGLVSQIPVVSIYSYAAAAAAAAQQQHQQHLLQQMAASPIRPLLGGTTSTDPVNANGSLSASSLGASSTPTSPGMTDQRNAARHYAGVNYMSAHQVNDQQQQLQQMKPGDQRDPSGAPMRFMQSNEVKNRTIAACKLNDRCL